MGSGKQRRRAKLKDVAALAETSTATVSRVLSGKGPVADETRARVLQAIETLNYHPNPHARNLRRQTSHNIGLVIPNLLNTYYIALADAISQLLSGSGYYLLLSATRDDPDIEQGVLYDLIAQNVDGLIWVPAEPNQDLIGYLQTQGIPAVTIVRRILNDPLDTVVFEDFKGSYAATQHLINLGHRSIGYVGGNAKYSSNQARWQGYLAAMRDAGLTTNDAQIRLGPVRASWGEVATIDMLRLSSPPTAIFVASNAIMPGVIRILRQRSLKIPDEMSLVCFDDLNWFSFSVPPITAISISPANLAQVALDLLFSRIREAEMVDKTPLFLEINYELILRSSTGPPRPDSVILAPPRPAAIQPLPPLQTEAISGREPDEH